MQTILFIIQKEFIQIFRNKMMLPLIFVVPIVQLFVLVYAANFEMKNIKLSVIDMDLSTTSRQMVSKFAGSPFYQIKQSGFSFKEAEKGLLGNKIDMILQIPSGFEKSLMREDKAKVQVIINAINGTSAGITSAYTYNILADFSRNIIADWKSIAKNEPVIPTIQTTYSFWFNPQLNYKTFMVPGILVVLVTLIGMFLTGLNLVREKEMGTIEQINVTPIKKYQFIIGKLLPFWIIAIFELAFGLTVGKLMFDIPIVGSIPLLFLIASVYLLVVLGLGLFVSTTTSTQQQTMFVFFFFIIIFILMSGLFTSVDSIPEWAKLINRINPVAYFLAIIRMILLKGSGFSDVSPNFYALCIYAFIALTLAVWRYRKTV